VGDPLADVNLLDALRQSPNPVAARYSHARVADRLLLTGHSHQAWPDAALVGVKEGMRDAYELVDDKWDAAFERAERVRRGYRGWLHDPDAEIALGSNTHELVLRMLSALDVVRVPPAEVAGAVDDRTAAVMMSAVLFETATVVEGLDAVADAAERHGAAAGAGAVPVGRSAARSGRRARGGGQAAAGVSGKLTPVSSSDSVHSFFATSVS
jgi:kynureninase